MSVQQDKDDLLGVLFGMSGGTKRPSVQQARLSYFPEWDRERMLAAMKALLDEGAIINLTLPMLNVDISSTGRKQAEARAEPNPSSSTTYNIGSMHNSPLQHVEIGATGTQSTTYATNDLRAIVELYRAHVNELDLDDAAKRKADAAAGAIEAQLTDEPDPGIVTAAGRSLKRIVEGALGGALGDAVANPNVWAPLLRMFG